MQCYQLLTRKIEKKNVDFIFYAHFSKWIVRIEAASDGDLIRETTLGLSFSLGLE